MSSEIIRLTDTYLREKPCFYEKRLILSMNYIRQEQKKANINVIFAFYQFLAII